MINNSPSEKSKLNLDEHKTALTDSEVGGAYLLSEL